MWAAMNQTSTTMLQPDRFVRLALIVLGALVSGCASHPPSLGGDPGLQVISTSQMPVPERAEMIPVGDAYYVGPQDRLLIDVYGIPELSGREVQVDSQGIIAFPVAGRLDVNGKTAAEIGELLAQQLRVNYIRDPQVTVNLKEARTQVVTVEGQVTKPGLYPVVEHMSLVRTMALAGGMTEFARLDDVVVFREVKGQRYAALYNLKSIRKGIYPDPDIYANDVVVVGDSSSRRLFKDLLQAAPLLLSPLYLVVGKL